MEGPAIHVGTIEPRRPVTIRARSVRASDRNPARVEPLHFRLRSPFLPGGLVRRGGERGSIAPGHRGGQSSRHDLRVPAVPWSPLAGGGVVRSEEHTSELQSQSNLVCRLLLEKKKKKKKSIADKTAY